MRAELNALIEQGQQDSASTNSGPEQDTPHPAELKKANMVKHLKTEQFRRYGSRKITHRYFTVI